MNCEAPPSGKSSLVTEVMTRYLIFSCFANSAILCGSVLSSGNGVPSATEQNLQFRVQILPRISTVAVPRDQHSPLLGQFAFVQIVSNPSFSMVELVLLKLSPSHIVLSGRVQTYFAKI